MSDSFVGEIRLFAGNFAPVGWAICDGSLVPISQNTALFSVLGTNYGGDGKSTFGLPDLRDRVPMHQGSGPGLSERFIGEVGGQDSVTLLISEMPSHSHSVVATSNSANAAVPDAAARFGTAPGGRGQQGPPLYSTGTPNTMLEPQTITPTGNSSPISLIKPVLALTYIISLRGVYPPHP